MKRHHSAESAAVVGKVFAGENPRATAAEALEINVIYTDRVATAAAMKATEALAHGLADCIRLRAGIVVPLLLPLDQPLVSVEFFEGVLREVAGEPGPDGPELSIHLYLCRDWNDTLLEVLKPNSVVVMGARRRWIPTHESRLARLLRRRGIRVVLVDPGPTLRAAAPPHLSLKRWIGGLGAFLRRIRGSCSSIQSAEAREVN
ncbi:MAG TPA: hypothetical protein VNK23_05620 [Candidatus Dormibacteraeota bacterium]|nr:hypothetical protein [Candidatus Dormibacteraeota bacterium]